MAFDAGEHVIAEFVASMPPTYAKAFDADAIAAHHAIVKRRGDRSIHVEIWRELPERVVAVCVVGDDKPGLFSAISASLVASRIDILSAEAFCRTRADGLVEAVDLLWIRRLPGSAGSISPIRSKDVSVILEAIERASAGEIQVPGASARVRTLPPDVAPSFVTARVRFDTDARDGSTMLTVEAVDRPGLLLAVTQALFRAGLQIVGLRATTEQGRAVDRFQLAETDGSPLRRDRLLSLQTAILGALDEGALGPYRESAG